MQSTHKESVLFIFISMGPLCFTSKKVWEGGETWLYIDGFMYKKNVLSPKYEQRLFIMAFI